MNQKDYLPRLIDKRIENMLSTFGAVCIEGPKWCGKTWTSLRHCKSQVFIGDPTNNFQNRTLAQLDPSLIMEGNIPRLLDEWQEVPPIWDAVRYKVDQSGQKGQFILTGSATPNHKGILHSGAGRIARVRMNTMSLFESKDSSGQVSLINLFDDKQDNILTGKVDLKHLINLTVRGGWPGSLNVPTSMVSELPKSYLDAVIADDVFKLDGINRDLNKMQLLLKSLARNESTTATNRKLKNDVREMDDDIDVNTIAEYLNIFQRLFLISNQPAFSSNIRSSVRVKQAEKRHFIDPSLTCAILGATPEILYKDLNTYGFLFEAMCERDLRIYAETIMGKLYHYQDYNGNEIDAVIELQDGRWGAFEIKLGANQIDLAADNLLAINQEIKKDGSKAPSVLCVICGMTNAAYKRPDGVYVVPITALKD